MVDTQYIQQYRDSAKNNEEHVVESCLAPVVSSYEDLRHALERVTDQTFVATSGYFNPLHKNHISNIISSKNLAKDFLSELGYGKPVHLTVIVNGDWSAKDKLGGDVFMPAAARADIVRAIRGVDLVFIHEVEEHHQGALIAQDVFDIFTKGGDRDFDSLPEPEKKALKETNTTLVTNVGYDKREGTAEEVSSSKLRSIARGEV